MKELTFGTSKISFLIFIDKYVTVLVSAIQHNFFILDWIEVKQQRHEVNEVEEEHCKIKTSRKKAKQLHTCSQCGKSFREKESLTST